MDCLYTVFKYRLNGKKMVVNSGELFDNVQRAVPFNHPNRTVDRNSSIVKKRLLRKKYKKRLLSFLQKTKSTQISGSFYADRIEQAKKINIEVN